MSKATVCMCLHLHRKISENYCFSSSSSFLLCDWEIYFPFVCSFLCCSYLYVSNKRKMISVDEVDVCVPNKLYGQTHTRVRHGCECVSKYFSWRRNNVTFCRSIQANENCLNKFTKINIYKRISFIFIHSSLIHCSLFSLCTHDRRIFFLSGTRTCECDRYACDYALEWLCLFFFSISHRNRLNRISSSTENRLRRFKVKHSLCVCVRVTFSATFVARHRRECRHYYRRHCSTRVNLILCYFLFSFRFFCLRIDS